MFFVQDFINVAIYNHFRFVHTSGTTSTTTGGKKGKRTPLIKTNVQALAGASMEGISSEMIRAQIEASLREMIMQGSSRMIHHQIKPIEGVSGATEMEYVQHEATTSECHFEAT